MQSLEKGLTNTILNTDALTGLKQIPNNSIDCCITSPPYYALRKYGVPALWDNDPNCEHEWVHRLTKWHGDRGENEDRKEVFDDSFQIEGTHSDFCSKCNAWQGELGLEPTFQLYVEHLLQIFDEVKRVLKKEGSCWVVISDTYFGKPKSSTEGGLQNKSYGTRDSEHGYTNRGEIYKQTRHDFPDKSLCLIPERFAMGMIEHGWILRNKVIWHKRNCMPSSAKDRFTVDYENVYFFTKSQRYYFNTQYEPYQTHEDRPMGIYRANNWGYVSKYANTPYYGNGKKEYEENDVQNPSDVKRRILESMKKNMTMPPIGGVKQAGGQSTTYSGNTPEWKDGRIKRAVWTINTKPFPEAHFAVFPEKLLETPIDATCPEEICKECGISRENIYETDNPSKEFADTDGLVESNSIQKTSNPQSSKSLHRQGGGVYSTAKLKGLTSCDCNAGFTGGIVLDPFMGSGTTALVALQMNRRFIGIEPKKEYMEMAYKRIDKDLYQTKLFDF